MDIRIEVVESRWVYLVGRFWGGLDGVLVFGFCFLGIVLFFLFWLDYFLVEDKCF